ncbi:acetylornithine aminotransferase [Punctularia strigosozonata HHB-11173 SS5]|uniref:acetylornithine aminotransferase n=1 Tax=Punctularia strigosozonata (strain HHB-11173) TaxID=741275 RepID=UPI0004416C29|nr:acetylornithine aminotransferase [Punctularia strigosozonata HHB-11173 SS5]EIN10340.1 acetylornithine aminotransferase [Punctularia strigosozonata HHB-11173 SS5]
MSLLKQGPRLRRGTTVAARALKRPRTQLRWTSNGAKFASESDPRPVPTLPTSPSTKYIHPNYTFPSALEASSSQDPQLETVLKRADKYLLPVYARPSLVLDFGQGMYVWDTEKRAYLDFSAGIAVNALGHADSGFIKVLAETAEELSHSSNVFHNKYAGQLAELLVTLTQQEGGLGYKPGSSPSDAGAKVFFSNSGTEANEGALKIARKVGKDRWAAAAPGRSADDVEACDKIEIVCFENAFHGRSMGALSVTPNPKYQKPFAPLLPGVRVARLNSTEDLENGLFSERTCAVIVEPVQGEGGCTAAEEAWLRALRKKCDEVGAVLIYDEVQCGLYRTGSLWAHSTLPVDCHPDVVTMAKPLANGYPIGAVLMKDSVAATMTAGTHGTTFGGSPLACALGYHVLSRLSERPFVAHLAETSAYLLGRLELLPKWFPDILQPQIRGRGLILGLAFKDETVPAKIVTMARERGVLLLIAGKDAVRLVPSLIVRKEDVDVAVDVIEGCLASLGK